MKKNLFKYVEDIIDKSLPLLASAGSIVAVFYYLISTKESIKSNLLEPVIAIFASFLGAILSFIILKTFSKKREGNIFVSYSYSDKKFADKLIMSLKTRRFNVLYDEEVVKIGDNITETISDAIRKSDVVILILSQTEKKESFLRYELQIAMENNKKILPVITGSNVEIPLELKQIKYADFSKEYEDNIRQLTKSLATILSEKNNNK